MNRNKDGDETSLSKTSNEFTGSEHGKQGVDKVPGEETSNDSTEFTKESQKGKKVDADPTENEGKPSEQDL